MYWPKGKDDTIAMQIHFYILDDKNNMKLYLPNNIFFFMISVSKKRVWVLATNSGYGPMVQFQP